MTLFDKYGGVPVVTSIVRDFYKRMFRRPNLRRYFEGVDMEHLILHQVGFISYVMGKPIAEYEGRELKEAHQQHGITTALPRHRLIW
jgi:hemoglobin